MNIRNIFYELTLLGKCGGHFTAKNGLITSPSYPNAYDFDKNCVYIISGSEDTYIDLVILTFNLDTVDPYGGSLVTCRGLGTYDYVELRDGGSGASPLIAKLCGKDKPTLLHSTQNKMWIRCHFGSKFKENMLNHAVTLQVQIKEAGLT